MAATLTKNLTVVTVETGLKACFPDLRRPKRKNRIMTYFLVPDQETDRRIAKGKAAEQAPLADHKKAGRRLSLSALGSLKGNLAARNRLQELCL